MKQGLNGLAEWRIDRPDVSREAVVGIAGRLLGGLAGLLETGSDEA